MGLSKMEESSETPKDSPSQDDKAAPAGFAPRISEAMAEYLVNTITGTAKMVQASVEAQKSAQLACFHAEQSLAQARLSYVAARGLSERLLGFLSPPDYQGLFQLLPQPPIPYSEFCTIIRRTENVLLHPVLKCKPGFPARREPSPGSDFTCPPDIADDGLQGGIHDLRCFRSSCVNEMDEDGTDEEESRSLQIRGRNPSRHKQVETVLLEDQMGGTFVTQRHRSPRRSPSAGVEGLSPLVSEQELNSIQPLICCPSRQGGSGKFLSKVTRRKDQPQRENSDSDTDQSETSAKDT
ncbi:uncharacterized protein LOC133367504 [Rhineura floridana]|uniref:uncharacterized protein LOC133367504 n=1 Tax=Rhineura floridana TaxID=261503 RepID=UPI002AC805A1|nr:uncharacterized protein LOC133367504 [Rhineura floridana]